MKAVVYTKYGPPEVLQFTEVPTPAPKDDELLVKVQAASVNALDWRLMRAEPFLARMHSGMFKPGFPILGADIAGRVEAVGRNVSRFRPGDEVFGDIFGTGLGGFAEYVCTRESALVLKPANLSFEEAAAVPLASVTALHGLRDIGHIQAGQQVLINGASGGVGTFALQIAKALWAEVTAVCSPKNLEMARSLGADHVLDYTQGDFTKGTQRYDLILAANGYHPIFDYRRVLKPGGIYAMAGGTMRQAFQAMMLGPWISMLGDKKMFAVSSKPDLNALKFIADLLLAGKIKPVMDRRYPLSETADAIRYVNEGHAGGKVVITVGEGA